MIEKKVYLTEIQHKVYCLYVEEGLTQEQIAIKLYGSKKMQGRISKILLRISEKIRIPLTKQFHKSVRQNEYILKFDEK